MENLNKIIKLTVLCVLSVLFYNCTKSGDASPNFNYSVFTDTRDGHTYKYIKIGNQEWMAENLSFQTSTGSWNSYDSPELNKKYGRLYNWKTALAAVPSGWHLPSDAEWQELEKFVGMSASEANVMGYRGTIEGKKLRATQGWPQNGTDEVGFTALPGGLRSNSGEYYANGFIGYWWTSTTPDSIKAWYRSINYADTKVFRNLSFVEDAYSVRCIKN